MRLSFAIARAAIVLAAAVHIAADDMTCCTTDIDCEAKTTPSQQEYMNTYDKSVICVPECEGLGCDMFGLCQDCRACFNTCEGAAYYLQVLPGTPGSAIVFCPDSGLADYDLNCSAVPTPSPASETAAPTASPIHYTPSPSELAFTGAPTAAPLYTFAPTAVPSAAGAALAYASAPMPFAETMPFFGGGASDGGDYGGNVEMCASNADCGAQINAGSREWFCSSGYSLLCDAAACSESRGKNGRALWCNSSMFDYPGCRVCAFSCSGKGDDECVLCPSTASDFCAGDAGADAAREPTRTRRATASEKYS
ncbi:unnamed protein product [Phaeothamnion confervicola]